MPTPNFQPFRFAQSPKFSLPAPRPVVHPSLLEPPAVRGPGAPPAPLWGHPRATSAWETDERAAPALGRARQLAYPLLDLSEAAGGALGQRAARGIS